jgi:hypothetical protein
MEVLVAGGQSTEKNPINEKGLEIYWKAFYCGLL